MNPVSLLPHLVYSSGKTSNKVVPVLNQTLYEDVCGEWNCRSAHSEPLHKKKVSGHLHGQPLNLQRSGLQHLLHRKLEWLQSHLRRSGTEINLVTLLGIIPKFLHRPACIAVTTSTELSVFLHPSGFG